MTDGEDNRPTITFLYQLVKGVAARSYGLNVARLAGINEDIIREAALLSTQLERKVQKRRYVSTLQITVRNYMPFTSIIHKCYDTNLKFIDILCFRFEMEAFQNIMSAENDHELLKHIKTFIESSNIPE